MSWYDLQFFFLDPNLFPQIISLAAVSGVFLFFVKGSVCVQLNVLGFSPCEIFINLSHTDVRYAW